VNSAPPATRRLFNLRLKILLAMGVVALTVMAAFLVPGIVLRRQGVVEEFQTFVRSAAGTAALALSGDDLARIKTNADAATPEFQRVRAILESVRKINHLTEREVYILRPLDAAGSTEFVAMLQAQTFIGDRYTIRAENRAAFLAGWSSGEPTATAPYRDEHGEWISGYAPIFDRAGRPVAVIEVDAEMTRVMVRQRDIILTSLALAAVAIAIGTLPGLWLARSITRGLHQLAEGMRRFQAGDHAVQVATRTGDEIEQLGAAFNDMILALREKLALLPYVSRFTAEAVRRSRDDPSLLAGSELEVCVLFADLRGFTSFSEQREASVLVRELNSLLAVQADVVVSAGGDVDKFIGDAVMAVFLDAEQAGGKVLACARQLIARMHEETQRNGWPLGLGVGIHRGRAVVGSIGSATRRDFTAIGHTVNLAARLCEKAAPWEILVTDAFLATLDPAARAAFRQTAPIAFKNVQQAVTTHSLTTEWATA
jgi:class 3 adenylate cyclase